MQNALQNYVIFEGEGGGNQTITEITRGGLRPPTMGYVIVECSLNEYVFKRSTLKKKVTRQK